MARTVLPLLSVLGALIAYLRERCRAPLRRGPIRPVATHGRSRASSARSTGSIRTSISRWTFPDEKRRDHDLAARVAADGDAAQGRPHERDVEGRRPEGHRRGGMLARNGTPNLGWLLNLSLRRRPRVRTRRRMTESAMSTSESRAFMLRSDSRSPHCVFAAAAASAHRAPRLAARAGRPPRSERHLGQRRRHRFRAAAARSGESICIFGCASRAPPPVPAAGHRPSPDAA